ncbi:hypothetical protein ASG11_02600 [Sphingomonas sp. Leaf357]|uniref:aspartyl protease family protein n=1 Tax=Sphingomonas sp. Leaf357 TaxID=1736350 RepID=UPI0006F43DDB|nr:aspartyl protease family protein [Sphingomonas sp. Leaf357]KQS03287.1 hypothetical protein ASG11_02600 [Sphingomonas sp. Leaf357]
MPIVSALIALLLATPGTAAPAPQEPIDPATTETAPTLNFGDDEDRMTLPVTISGAGPYRFIVDTGAQRTVISRELAGLLKLNPGRDVRMTTMTGSSSANTVIIPLISVGAFGGSRIEAPALEGVNLGAAGLLGIDTLQDRALSIDFDLQRMTVRPSVRRHKAERAGPDEIIVHAKSIYGQLVVTDAYYGDVKVRVVLDTGTAVTMGNLALKKRVRHGKMKSIDVTSVTGSVLQADYTSISALKIGSVSFNDLPIAFADAAPFAHFGLDKRPALLLGMDALRLFRRIDIDFPNRELRLALPRRF